MTERYNCNCCLQDLFFVSFNSVNAGLLFDPVQVVLGPGEASRVSHLAAGAGPEAHDAVLHPPLPGLFSNTRQPGLFFRRDFKL